MGGGTAHYVVAMKGGDILLYFTLDPITPFFI